MGKEANASVERFLFSGAAMDSKAVRKIIPVEDLGSVYRTSGKVKDGGSVGPRLEVNSIRIRRFFVICDGYGYARID